MKNYSYKINGVIKDEDGYVYNFTEDQIVEMFIKSGWSEEKIRNKLK